MLPSEEVTINKLSKLQREFLIAHFEQGRDGFKPFKEEKIENQTRESLVARGIVRYDPPKKGMLGCPRGTVLTDPLGRQAASMVLGWYADSLIEVLAQRQNREVLNTDRQVALLKVLAEQALHWRTEILPTWDRGIEPEEVK